MMRILCIALPVALLGAWGCTAGPTASEPESSEGADLVALRYGDLVVGKVIFACRAWDEDAPTAQHVTVDLFFSRESAAEPNTAPTHAQLLAVRNAGGTVLHEYPVMAVRATMPRSAIQSLAQEGVLNHARAVAVDDRFDLGVTIGYSGDGSELMQQFQDVGGHVDDVFESLPAFHGVVPDSALPILRTTGGLRYIQHDQISCLT